MPKKIDREMLFEVFENVVETVNENKEELTELDSKIGDGDHGVNLARGFTSSMDEVSDLHDQGDIGEILKEVGSILMESIGGSVGILYGSAVQKAGDAIEGKDELSLEDLVSMIEAADQAIKKRGQVEVGQKTMYDTIHPFAESIKEGYEDGLGLDDALKKALVEAEEGMKSTQEMEAEKGRAKYFGEKTVGHIDVGAKSSYLIIKTAVNTIAE